MVNGIVFEYMYLHEPTSTNLHPSDQSRKEGMREHSGGNSAALTSGVNENEASDSNQPRRGFEYEHNYNRCAAQLLWTTTKTHPSENLHCILNFEAFSLFLCFVFFLPGYCVARTRCLSLRFVAGGRHVTSRFSTTRNTTRKNMAAKSVPSWTRKTPGQYGSNGINADGSLMNVGNKLGDRPSIKLFPQYNSGDTMRALLADCGGLGEGLGEGDRPGAILENDAVAAGAASAPAPATSSSSSSSAAAPEYNTIRYRPAGGDTDQFKSNFEFGTGISTSEAQVAGGAAAATITSSQPAKDEDAMTPQEAQRQLWEAARQGNTQLVKQALKYGANPMTANPTDGWLALHYAAAGNKRLTCQVLLGLPSGPQQCAVRNLAGETPLKLCSSKAVAGLIREAAE